jgi:hypothetical protein
MATVDGLLRQILGELRLRTPPLCTLDLFMNIVAGRLRTPTIIMFDEIGVALERYPALDATFWEGLRALAANQTEGRLGFLLACHKPPHELAQQSLGGSPFFNIFAYCADVGPLTDPEARSLVARSPVPFDERDVAWILEQSQRWPVLAQLLCRERLLALQEGDDSDGWREDALRQSAPFVYLLKAT